MDISKEHDRKGLVGTIFIHIILFLLLLIYNVGQANEMLEEQGGVEVSFGDPNSGGSDAISETAETQPTQTRPTETRPTSTEQETTPSTEPPVETTDQADAPEVNTPTSTTEPETEKEELGEVDSKVSDYLKNRKNNKTTGNENKNAGDNDNDKPGGNENSDKTGPGGQNQGKSGSGVSWSLSGFVVSGVPTIENNSQEFGTLKFKICLDGNGNIKYLNFEGGSTTSIYLKNLTEKSIRKFAFKGLGNQTDYNCGFITIAYKPH